MRTILGLLALAVLTATAARAAEEKWPKYAPEGGGFTLEMPAQWTPTTKTDADGIKTVSAEVIVKGIDYKAATITAGTATLPKGTLDAVRDAAVANVKGKLRKQQQFALGGHPCQQIIIDGPDNVTIIARLVNTGDKLLEAAITGPTGVETDPDTMHFFQSFKPTP